MRKEITTKEAKTLFCLFNLRVKYSPDKIAFKYFDKKENKYIEKTWQEAAKVVAQWQGALKKENLSKGELVGLMISTSYERTIFELAASGLGLVTVPMPINAIDSASYMFSMLEYTQVKLLLIQNELQEGILLSFKDRLHPFKIIRLDKIDTWLPQEYDIELYNMTSDPDGLTTIHYTSGTSGKLKGAMLSHRNILSNAEAISHHISVYDDDIAVTFTGGSIFPMMMDFATAFPKTIDDLQIINPTHIVSANRLYEYIYKLIQISFLKNKEGDQFFDQITVTAEDLKKIFGNRLRYGFYAGGVLPSEITNTFIEAGLPLLGCYGQAEAGAVISMNTPDDNNSLSVGKPLNGIDVKIEDGELLIKSSSVMVGYWKNPSATEATIKDGWLHTGDIFRIDSKGHLFFIGRKSDIIVTQNGDKISPLHIEAAIKADLLFDQAMVIGKNRPFLTALLVLNKELWEKMAESLKLDIHDPLALKDNALHNIILKRIAKTLIDYPDYVKIERVTLLTEEWRVGAGLLTTSLKLKREEIYAKYEEEIRQIYL
ncbi:MAG: AMP-binding protein [Desulfamplus sp.]|nr:AMP-binding protein [Desulfamplus sp.]